MNMKFHGLILWEEEDVWDNIGAWEKTVLRIVWSRVWWELPGWQVFFCRLHCHGMMGCWGQDVGRKNVEGHYHTQLPVSELVLIVMEMKHFGTNWITYKLFWKIYDGWTRFCPGSKNKARNFLNYLCWQICHIFSYLSINHTAVQHI